MATPLEHLEIFGIPLGFGFSWYIHGPYDRNLTAVLYDNHPEYSDREIKQITNESQKIANLKEFLGTDIHNSRTLELIVSLHYLYHIGKKNNTSDPKILEQLLELKPQFKKAESEYYLKRIKKYF